jgi:hypothetical protein
VGAEILYVVMGGEIVLAAYWRMDLAARHSRCLTGTTVAVVNMTQVTPTLLALIKNEILHELPASIVEDIQADAEGWNEDPTPEVVGVDDLDDVKR